MRILVTGGTGFIGSIMYRVIFAKPINISDVLDEPDKMVYEVKDCTPDWIRNEIEQWKETPGGIWAIANSRQELAFDTSLVIDQTSILLRIHADFTDENYTYWKLTFT